MARGRNKYPLRKIVGYEPAKTPDGLRELVGVFNEILECGHRQAGRSDIYGETHPERRRCYQCGRESSPNRLNSQ